MEQKEQREGRVREEKKERERRDKMGGRRRDYSDSNTFSLFSHWGNRIVENHFTFFHLSTHSFPLYSSPQFSLSLSLPSPTSYFSLPLAVSLYFNIMLNIFPVQITCSQFCTCQKEINFLSLYLSIYVSIYRSLYPSFHLCLAISPQCKLYPYIIA